MTRGQGIAIGVISFLAGVAVGMLFAPKSGKELRQELRQKLGEATDLYGNLNFSNLTEEDIERELTQKDSRR
ncbi:MAG: YtxH domain-containing protein [Chloroherpetonaceae bacterium]|nr:YtxH domain-containing protein [Chloroherpetonaceae bacterium]MDW8437104.1 YtxH domain-containing protein [Chloroherpetonaceae bacterium]